MAWLAKKSEIKFDGDIRGSLKKLKIAQRIERKNNILSIFDVGLIIRSMFYLLPIFTILYALTNSELLIYLKNDEGILDLLSTFYKGNIILIASFLPGFMIYFFKIDTKNSEDRKEQYMDSVGALLLFVLFGPIIWLIIAMVLFLVFYLPSLLFLDDADNVYDNLMWFIYVVMLIISIFTAIWSLYKCDTRGKILPIVISIIILITVFRVCQQSFGVIPM